MLSYKGAKENLLATRVIYVRVYDTWLRLAPPGKPSVLAEVLAGSEGNIEWKMSSL